MTFKSTAQLFGDGGAYGPALPVSTSNPTGYGVANRGIANGESVEGSVANRTTYALALNGDDLNARLLTFESYGLDRAYDVYRQITKDAGAIQTTSALATLYADDVSNAHFRADASGDVIAGGGGFDAVSGPTSAFGYLARTVLQFSTTNTNITAAPMNASLNPGGAGSNIIRLTDASRQFHGTGGLSTNRPSELMIGDLVEVTAGTYKGIYQISSFSGLAITDARVVTVGGTTPAFSPSTSATVRVCRPTAVIGPNNAIYGYPGTPALYINTGAGADNDVGGSTAALRVEGADTSTGVGSLYMKVDAMGRVWGYQGLTAGENLGGLFSFIKDYSMTSGTLGEGFLATNTAWSVGNTVRHDFTSIIPTATDLGYAVSITLGANSPTNGEVGFASAPSGSWYQSLPVLMVGRINSGSAEDGHYLVVAAHSGGIPYLLLRKLDGSVPSTMATSGTRTLELATFASLGRLPALDTLDALVAPASGVPSLVPYNLLSAGTEVGATALLLGSPSNTDTSQYRAFLRCWNASEDTGTGSGRSEVFAIAANGRAYSRSGFVATDSAEFSYGGARSRTILFPLTALRALSGVGGANQNWYFDDASLSGYPRWVSTVNAGMLFGALNGVLRKGMKLKTFVVEINPGAGNTVTIALYRRSYVSSGSGSTGTATLIASTTANNTPSAGTYAATLDVTSAPEAASLDTEAYEYYLRIQAGSGASSNNDILERVKITVDDFGPRNN